MARRIATPLTPPLVLDTGALIALERGDASVRRHLENAARLGCVVVAPVMVVMEAMAGARSQARLNQILAVIDVELPLTPTIAHQAVGLKARAGVGSDVDAIVVLEALAMPGSAILTSDPSDIHALLEAAGSKGRVPVLRV